MRPGIQIHDGVLGDPPRHPIRLGRRRDPPDPAVGQVVDVIEGRHVDPAGARQPQQQLATTTGATLGLPGGEQVGHLKDCLLAIAHDRCIDEGRHRLGVERRVSPGDDDRVILAPLAGVQGYAG